MYILFLLVYNNYIENKYKGDVIIIKNNTYKNKNWLVKEYSLHGSSTIARKCNVDDSTIIYWLKKFNIKIRTRKESLSITDSRKNLANRNYFKNINTPQKAYWLGFLMADCTIINKGNGIYYFSFELSIKDKNIVEQFAKDIEFQGKIYYTKNKVRLFINDTLFTKNLMKYGIIENKTGKEIFPNIKEKYNKYFILGFFDGDGSIMFYNNKQRIRSRFHIVSCNEKILKQIKEELSIKANVIFTENSLHRKYTGCNEIYELETSTLSNIMKIYDYFYYNENIFYMKRKYNKFLELKKHYVKNPTNLKRYSPNFIEI